MSVGSGLEVDIHAVVFDGEGNGVYRMQNGEDWIFPAEGFRGRGVIDGTHTLAATSPTGTCAPNFSLDSGVSSRV